MGGRVKRPWSKDESDQSTAAHEFDYQSCAIYIYDDTAAIEEQIYDAEWKKSLFYLSYN